MKTIMFAPHNDDESLFAAYTCLRHHPRVVVCLRSVTQLAQGVAFETREAETRRACSILGVGYEQWGFVDLNPDWDGIVAAMRAVDLEEHPDTVYAPAVDFEANGHTPDDTDRPIAGVLHHDMIGYLADEVFGGRVIHYQTYTRWGGRVREGVEVDPDPGWPGVKQAALACYESQIALESTGHHFTEPFDEWLTA